MSCSYVLAGHKEVILSLDTCVSSSGNVLIVTGSKDKTVSPFTHLVVFHKSCSSQDFFIELAGKAQTEARLLGMEFFVSRFCLGCL